MNTWLLGNVATSLVDGTPRLWGGWYGRTLYVTDRNGIRLWQQSYAYDAWMIQHVRLADVNNDGRKEVLLAVNNTIEARDANTGIMVKHYSVGANVTTFELVPGEPASPCDGLARLGEQIVAANLPARNIRPLLASLEAACASVALSNTTAAVNQLEAFQHKVLAQVAKKDPALAEAWVKAAQDIINQPAGTRLAQGQGAGPDISHPARNADRAERRSVTGFGHLTAISRLQTGAPAR